MDKLSKIFEEEKLSGYNKKELAEFLANKFKIEKSVAYFEIEKALNEGELVLGKDDQALFLPKELNLVKAKLSLSARGYGFAIIEGRENDLFIPKAFLGKALNGDTVLVEIQPDKFNPEKEMGIIRQVVKRTDLNIVGTVEKGKRGSIYVVPDNNLYPAITIPREFELDARKGDKVVVKIKDYSDKAPSGEIVEVLGESFKPEVELLGIARSYNLDENYPEEQLRLAEKVPQELTAKDLEGRLDLRGERIITIDGDDAKDLDDAISLTKNADGTWHLGVHIADVGNYVPMDSVLDQEAFERATSVYFPRFVIPMLPKALSNGICSLNPQVPRLTLSVFMDIDNQGKVIRHSIHEAVIESKERMTYNNVQKILDGDEALRERYKDIVPMIEDMSKLSDILKNMRLKRGEVDFELRETKIELDENNEVSEVKEYPYLKSNEIIESFMLVANETVAQHYEKLKMPFCYRVHQKPDSERYENFLTFIKQYGVNIKDADEGLNGSKLQNLFDEISGEDYSTVVRRVALRTMKKAIYSPSCDGHFALNAPYYCHFTSPIRRYPDLCIHRIIKKDLRGELNKENTEYLKGFVAKACKQSSEKERNADEAERAVDDYLKCLYMKKHLGEEYEGVISGVSESAIFVELPNTIEGQINVADLPKDTFEYDDIMHRLVGKNHTYRLGDTLKIKVLSSNEISRELTFGLVREMEAEIEAEKEEKKNFVHNHQKFGKDTKYKKHGKHYNKKKEDELENF